MRIQTCVFILALAAFSGCTKMEDYYDGEILTQVGDEEFIVRKRSEGNFMAMPNHADHFRAFSLDARVGPMNVAAIEKVTGCKVPIASIQNHGLATFATIDCS